MPRISLIALIVAGFCLLAGCGDKDPNAYSGKIYEPTQRIATAFQYTQVPDPCRVFAELLVAFPANQSGLDLQQAVFKEAREKGADLILVGQTRLRDDNDELQFIYYGPQKEYLCSQNWCGWKYGYDEWKKQGEWTSIGLPEWGDQEIRFEEQLMMQVAFLRCR